MSRLKFINAQGQEEYLSARGQTGPAGQDAISIVITSSNGSTFTDGKINTTLTAHVYKGGKELNSSEISELGAINWFKNNDDTTVVGRGSILIITNEAIVDKTMYVAKLISTD